MSDSDPPSARRGPAIDRSAELERTTIRRTRSALMSNVREEFRAPVSAILEYSRMLLEDAAGPGREEILADLGKIRQAGEKLLATVDELLAPERLGAERTAEEDEAFSSSVRHELRTPLNHIIGYGEMLLEDAPDLDAGELVPDLERIVSAGRQLLTQIDALLLLSQGGAARAQSFEESTTAHVVEDMFAALQPLDRDQRRSDAESGHILVVDDNAMNRDVLARRLERKGHRVAAAVNGRQALEKMAAEPYDLVLLDMVMPEMNGYEVLERLKGDPALRDIPVIMITAVTEIASVVRCLELGAEDYLNKPFNPVVLDARIGACLEKKHLRDREVLYLRRIEEEQKKSDRLLRVILPGEIVEELKETDRVRPRIYRDVAVLFTDVVGFTAFCNTHPVEEVSAALQELVEAFERIAAGHRLEKIKTIGDAFMATAGLLEPVDNPTLSCVRCGLDMVAAAPRLGAGWQVRVGIHTGDLMAGVVGHNKYLFDIWGDTVNTAARMESTGVPGQVAVSSESWLKLDGLCEGSSRGTVEVKGKGEMEVFLVKGLRDAAADGAAG